VGPFWMLIAAVSVVAFIALLILQGIDPTNTLDMLKLIPSVAMVDGIVYAVFARWVWRWSILQGWLVPFPDLEGTWNGEIRTSWTNAQDEEPAPISVYLTIKQTFGRVSCVMRTDEMESHSYAESFSIDDDDQVRRLCYTYASRPKQALRSRSTPHDGTVLFNVIGKSASRLEGEYWTQRGTTGTVNLKFVTRELIDSMSGGKAGEQCESQ